MDKGRKYEGIPFREELESLAASHRPVGIVFRSANGARTVVRDRVEGLLVREGRECLRTGGGLVIGLDQLEEIDGLRPPGAC